MKKKFKYQERKGLPGGPNEISTYLTGVFSIDGYKRNSPDVNNPYNIIPSGNITMKGVDFPVMGTDNLGNMQMMMPGYDYKFPGNAVFEIPMAQEGNGEIISLSTSDPRYAEYYNRLNKDVVLADPSGKTAGRIFLDEVDVVADKATPPAFNFPGFAPPVMVQDQIAKQTPFRFSPEGIAAEKSYQEYQDYIKSLPYDQRPGYIQPTISEYVPPSTAEWWWDKISHPMTSLGYVMRGQTDIMPDRVGNQPDRNAFDYAVDIVNPATYINTVGDVYESVSEGDIVGAGIDAISLAPIVPTSVKQGKNLLKRSVQVGNQYVTPLSYKRVYQFNPFANQRPPFTTVVRTQMPGQTGKLVMGQHFDDLANQGKKLNWRQNLDRNSSRRFGWGRGFSSDAGDIINYSHPSMTAYRGYDSNLINPELLIKRLPTSYLDDFMVANLSSGAQKAYGSGKKFSEFILPIEDVLSAERRALSKEAYDEIRNIRNAELTPHWLKGFQEVKPLGGSLPSYQTRGEVPNEILNWQDNAEWFNNRAVFSDNADYNDLIKKLTLAGTHGYNPSTGTLHKLETPVSVSPDIAYNVNKGTVQNKRNKSNVKTTRSKDTVPVQISNEDWWNPSFYFQTPSGTANAQDFAGQTVYMSPEEAEAYNKEMVRYNMNKVYQDSKIWRAPGAAYLAAFAGPGTFAAGENAGLGLTNTIGSYWNAPLTVGSRTIPGVTVGNTVNSAFAADFLANRAPEIPGQIAREEYGDAALNVGFGALDLVGAGALNSLKSLKNIKTSSPIINRIRYGKATPQNFGEALVGHPIKNYDDILIRPYLNHDQVARSLGSANTYSGVVRRLNKFLNPIGDVADDFTALINSRLADLRSPEGFRRLVNQEKGYLQQLDGFPVSELETQAKINAHARISEFESLAAPGGTLNSEAQILLNSGKLTPESAHHIISEDYLFGNAFYGAPHNQISLDGWRPNYDPTTGFLIKKNQSILGGMPLPGRIGVSSTYSHTPMMSHELAHALQRNRTLPIDQELRNIVPKSNLSSENLSQFKYFKSGSSGHEPSAFANELRESMLERGIINSRYEFITPEKLKVAQLSFYNKPMGVYAPNRDTRLINQGVRGDFLSTTRILDFMEPSANNYRRLANALNKLPATTVGLGLGAAAYSQGEYKRGGQLPTYQTRGETPLTRDEIFNIPRTVRYENGNMVLQDKPIWDGFLDEVTITPTTASEYAWQENRANQSTGGLEPIYPIFDLMSSGLRAPLTKGAKAMQGALTSEKTLGALARSPYVPKFTKPGLIKNYKSKFPNVDLRGTGTGNYNKLGVNELGLGVDDFGSLTNYERSAISQVNQTQPADEVFNTFVQRYADFNTDDALANQLADFSRRNPRTKFEINLGRDVTPSKRMQEIFNDPELNVHNVFSYESSGPMNPINKWGHQGRLFYDASARNPVGEFEKNLRSYGQQGFYAANVPMGKPVKQALTYNKDGRVFDYVKETLPVSDFVVNKGLMNPDVIGNFSRYRGAGDMANQHNFLLGITNSPSVIISGNKGFAGLKGGNKIREKIGGLITPTGGKAVPSHNTQVVPLLKQEFNLSEPFEGTFIKSPSILETYYNSKGQASPYTNFPGILDIDDLFIKQKGGEPPNDSNLYPLNPQGIPMDTLDEVTVTGDRFKEKWWSFPNLATFGLLNEAKRRLTKNIHPFGYDGLYKVTDALFYPDKPIDWDHSMLESNPELAGKTEAEMKRESIQKQSGTLSPLMERQQLFQYMMGQDASQYDGIPLSGEGYGLRTSKYKPTKASNPNAYYFSSPTTEYQIKNKIQEIVNNKNKSLSSRDVSKYELGSVLGNYHLSKGEDDKGKYISYYDIWDLDPFHPGHTYTAPSDLPFIGGMDFSGDILHSISDMFQYLGDVKPAELYGRVYYTENPDGTINVLDEKQDGGSLPKAQEGNGETHTVASGETFFGIANKYKLDKQDLIDANPGLNIESIKAGQTINLPVIERMEPVTISAADSKREPTSWTDYINPYNWGVTDRDDDGTFNQAFRAARNAGEDEFMWYGTRYNTNLKPTLDKSQAEEVSNEVETVKETGPFNNYSVTPELLYKQAFVESTLDPKAENQKGYMGLAQIGDDLITDYKNKNGIQAVDPFDPQQNHDVQEWSMNELYNATFINKPGSTNENRLLKALASYNWGRGNVKALLEKQKAKGVDIYTDTSWTSELPKETREYIDMILYDGATEKRPLVQENFKNALVDSTYKDIRDLYIYKSGGEKNEFQIYKDYVEGVYDGTEMEKAAEKIYDKLNRVYYKEAKKQGMRVPNYIMTNVIKQIDN